MYGVRIIVEIEALVVWYESKSGLQYTPYMFRESRGEIAYREPNDKRIVTEIFVFSFICVLHRMIPGSTAQARSVAIEQAVEVYDKPIIALVPEQEALPAATREVFQLASTGRQRDKTPIKVVR
jgi:hypothetical protein